MKKTKEIYPPLQMIKDYNKKELRDSEFENKGKKGKKQKPLTETKKPAPTDGDGPTLDASLIERLIQLTPEEREKVEVFVQGMIAGRENGYQ